MTGVTKVPLSSVLGVAGGSALVGFQQAGVSAAVRTVQAKARDFITPEDFGADPTGSADSAAALAAAFAYASSVARPVWMGGEYKLSTSVAVPSIRIVGNGSRLVATDATKYALTFSGSTLAMSGVSCSGAKGLLHITANFDAVDIVGCGFAGTPDTLNLRAVMVDSGVSAGVLSVTGGKFSHCTPVYADNLDCDDLIFDDNEVVAATQFVVRCLPQPQNSDPETSAAPKRLWFRRNRINGVNTGLTDKSVVARVVQASAKERIIYDDNRVYHLNTTGAGTLIYWLFGSLEMTRNKFARIESTTIAVDQKSNGVVVAKDYYHKIHDNTFDQSEVAAEDDNMEAAIRVYSESNVEAYGNTFIGLRCPTHMVWHSVDLGITPSKFVFRDETVYDHKFPVCVVLLQQSDRTRVSGFTVHGISNPDAISYNSETRCRLVDVVMSADNGLGISNVHVFGNTIYTEDTTAVVAHLFISLSAPTAYLTGVTISANEMPVGAAIARFQNGSAMGTINILANTGPTSTVYIGSSPAVLNVSGNLP